MTIGTNSTTSRELAYGALADASRRLRSLKIAERFADVKYQHEIDNGYGPIDTVDDALASLYSMAFWLVRETATHCHSGCYEYAIRTAGKANDLTTQIALIEGRRPAQ